MFKARNSEKNDLSFSDRFVAHVVHEQHIALSKRGLHTPRYNHTIAGVSTPVTSIIPLGISISDTRTVTAG
jgi:hypothetical protein